MINEIVSYIPFFGLFLTALVYAISLKLSKKLKIAIFNPLVITCVVIIILLYVTGIDYDVFSLGALKADGTHDGTGAIFFQLMLTPTTVCLVVPLYENFAYLKKYPFAILAAVGAGAATAVLGVLAVALIFGLAAADYVTLLPKSVTTAIGMGLSSSLGGNPGVTAAVIAVTGIFGNVSAPVILKLFKINHPVAKGLACGTSAHAIGTTRAREFGTVEEAMSGLSIAVCGLITVVLATVMAALY